MHRLPTELQISVLDYVVLKSDLRSLCLTSKALCALALPRLYHTVKVVIQTPNLGRFSRSLTAGAGRHLQFTRVLIIEDIVAAFETYYDPASSLVPNADFHVERPHKKTSRRLDVQRPLSLILQAFPHHQLRTFQYVSMQGLPSSMWAELHRQQHNLEDIRSTFSACDPFNHEFGAAVRFLDMHFIDNITVGTFFKSVLNLKRLERLSLSFYKCDLLDVEDYFRQISHSRLQDLKTRFKEVNLRELQVDYEPWALSDVFEFSRLERLTLRYETPDEFLYSLSKQFRGAVCLLQHLAVDLNAATSILSVLDHCPALTSLHLFSSDVEGDALGGFMQKLAPFGSRLRTLALPQLIDSESSCSGQKLLLESLSSLRYLACHIYYHDFDDPSLDSNPAVFGNYFRHLDELRVVHFRIMVMNERTDSNEQMSWKVHRFVRALWHHLDKTGICPNLKIMVIGGLTAIGEDETDKVPQFSFMKGYQTDLMGRKSVIPVQTPVSMVRHVEPECDLLEYDQDHIDHRGFPGRFYDVGM